MGRGRARRRLRWGGGRARGRLRRRPCILRRRPRRVLPRRAPRGLRPRRGFTSTPPRAWRDASARRARTRTRARTRLGAARRSRGRRRRATRARRRAAFLAAARPVVVVDPREEECDAAQIYGGSVDGDDVASTLRAAGLLPRDAGAGSRSITSRRAEALAVYRVCECVKAERPSASSSADPPAAAKGRTFVPATLLATFVGAAVAETRGGSRVEGALRDGAANDDSHSPAEEEKNPIPPNEFASALEAAFDAGFAAASSLRSRRSGARPPWVPASFDGERAEAARDALGRARRRGGGVRAAWRQRAKNRAIDDRAKRRSRGAPRCPPRGAARRLRRARRERGCSSDASGKRSLRSYLRREQRIRRGPLGA